MAGLSVITNVPAKERIIGVFSGKRPPDVNL
jgi:hypothetical protein